jgi:hypothetical protein
MAYQVKTKETEGSVKRFWTGSNLPGSGTKPTGYSPLFTEATGLPAKLWGDSLIGFWILSLQI